LAAYFYFGYWHCAYGGVSLVRCANHSLIEFILPL
jgi:hypothetical protein